MNHDFKIELPTIAIIFVIVASMTISLSFWAGVFYLFRTIIL